MIRILIILILLFCAVKSEAQDSTLSSNKIDFIVSAFSSIIVNNEAIYIKHIYSKEALKYRGLRGRLLSPEQEKKFNLIVDIGHGKYIEEQEERFKVIQSKIKEFNIEWKKIAIDSVTFKPDTNDTESASFGTIYFRKNDNTEFYKTNFESILKFQGRYYLETIYVPHIYVGPKNRIYTNKIKQQYINTCISKHEYNLSMVKGSPVFKAMNTSCPRCDCEKQYVSETEQNDGVTRVIKYIKEQPKTLKSN